MFHLFKVWKRLNGKFHYFGFLSCVKLAAKVLLLKITTF